MNKNNYMISIVIPVYNSKKYLNQLFDSIIEQGNWNFEVIIVDDGSTDESFSMCLDFSEKHSNIQVFRRENQGVSKARNFGLSKVSGKYIMFLDSDDYLSHNSIKIINGILEKEQPDIMSFNFNIIKEDIHYIHSLSDVYNEEKSLCQEEAFQSLLSTQGFRGFVWNKVYRYEVIKDILFPENIHYLEDTIFNVQAIYNSSKLICSREPLVYYRQHDESAVAKFTEKQLTYLDALDILLSKLPSKFSEEIRINKLLFYISTGSNALFESRLIYKKMSDNFKLEKDKLFFKNSNLKLIEKMLLKVGYFNFTSSVLLYSLKKKIVKSKLYFKLRQ